MSDMRQITCLIQPNSACSFLLVRLIKKEFHDIISVSFTDEVIMKKLKNTIKYFSTTEIILWCSSVALIIFSFIIFDRENYLTLAASLVGITSLIFCAKGNPAGQLMMVVFSAIYGVISFGFAYYGEMLTYLGMTLPMATVSLVTWLKNPYKNNKSEVEVRLIKKSDIYTLIVLTPIVTVVFFFLLRAFGNANLIPSTLSVATSFIAAFLCFRRSPYFALAYAINDMVLILLWILAALEDPSYFSVIICFLVFLVNDLYSFANWRKMQRRQGAK
jgi:nicotinamide mononucleotide transporter PnuC